jgi:surface antigen
MHRLGFGNHGNNAKPAAGARNWVFGITVTIAAILAGHTAAAHTKTSHKTAHISTHHTAHHAAATHQHVASHRHHAAALAQVRAHGGHETHSRTASLHYRYRNGHYRYASTQYRHSYLQCVPYAREVSHIELSGNAFLWWGEAAGRYARGNAPVQGAVLNFRAIGRMPLGHVAVVTGVVDNRTVLVTQANWIRGTITNDVTVQDVSPNNDWTQVEVELGDSSKWGAPYPTYGFIYNQPDNGTVIAGATPAATNEVAEAPRAVTLQTDAPDRDLQ